MLKKFLIIIFTGIITGCSSMNVTQYKENEQNWLEEIISPDLDGWDGGHNAEPINTGRCCDSCTSTFVIPHRIKLMFESECG